MEGVLVLVLLILMLGGILDRVLLQLEERGWINYRRNGISRGAIAYHMLELQAILDPGTRQIIEVRYEEREEESDSGGPPA